MKIGLEVHVQLPTKSKLFCSCPTGSENGPNGSICPVCLGFPGSKPSLNRKALEMGILIAKFMGCTITDRIWFSRKTYFYPDLPKNFQTTQYESPVGTDGVFVVGGKEIHINRVHIEEDPGRIKRVGKSGSELALIDYDRSGIPLVEIVTAPDMSSPAEAREFLTTLMNELRQLIGVSGQEQTMRVDANISVGVERVEIKNITGVKNVERGLKFEVIRQTKMLAAKKKIVRETRHFDEERGVTTPGREKEFEEDYGYIGEPDLGTYTITEMAAALKVPETPLIRAKRFEKEYGMQFSTAKQLVATSWDLADIFEELAAKIGAEKAASWCLGALSSRWKGLQEKMSDELHETLLQIVIEAAEGKITDSDAKLRIEALSKGKEISSTDDVDVDVDSLITQIADEHPEVVEDYRTNPKAANFIIGRVMKETKGKFSSQEIAEKAKKELESRL
ncbi:Asp-tRNA(Asn)/Glu-tRNA(Gln) amidotransferase subunit GatB [Candidatus Methanomassiliicoccus intestinalis]|uniref:Aspartyl/glutamyl-tRNA(Asn/Gln) amidotransferase subunit B n=1 Tax=Methanomassiliicoccus intestinalis (strain Issoire-Mx1) TaxID=1295009 RepID=R9T8U1_METII|nr:Asp-tRNA(Asn)/Glu-tRNA(Gln) amidotransferase subunit GatB [Candidatus Methanomassiliicoccus intestinalis]AGN25778.1 aspartyl/glutamyl-tRNA amidotransferase subunit B [Candidatus Methanomassiliicoccus intestinalis Issoire-Mx1]